ncbi:MAG: hypothetical protein LBE35_00810, partial [Clostridiales bacterium]|nr:hypothetical protein [Clostridiales bacterium]
AEGSPPAIIPHPDKLLPPDGIYNTTICLDNKAHKSVAEIAKNSLKIKAPSGESIEGKMIEIFF